MTLADAREVVLIGEVRSTRFECAETIACESPGPGELGTGWVTIKVQEYLKGAGPRLLVLKFPTGIGGTPYFKSGDSYLLYPVRTVNGLFVTMCHVYNKAEDGFLEHNSNLLNQIREKY
ncbi:MAG: hypothetical protein AB8G18_19275 [Gammaproteobacteria bacterium]